MFKTAIGTDDSEIETQFEQVMLLETKMAAVKKAIETFSASMVEMTWSADRLASMFNDQ